MKECKFKIGDKVRFISKHHDEGGLKYGSIYTVGYTELIDTEWVIGIQEDEEYRKWQWKFELAKNQIVRDIINDL